MNRFITIIFLPILLLFAFVQNAKAQVVINEVFPNPVGSSETGEFIEIFNSGSQAVVITGWKLSDISGTTKTYIFPEATLASGIYADFPKSVTGITLNNDSDGVELRDSADVLIDSMSYSQTTEGRSWSRIPNGTGSFIDNTEPSEMAPNISPQSSTPSPTPSSTPTQPPSPSSKAIYKLVEPEDNSGNELSSVQIYVDGNYIHHMDDEVLEFYSGNECYQGVSCGFGHHTISLRKDGYSNWEDTKDFEAGMNLEVTPILNKQNTATSTPTPTPTPTPTKSPLPSHKPTPTESPTGSPEDPPSTESGRVLGIEISSQSPTSTPQETITNKPQLFSFILIGVGTVFIGASIYLGIKTSKASAHPNDI